jgi:steroid delta-isomerase-like uncharacterized protein
MLGFAFPLAPILSLTRRGRTKRIAQATISVDSRNDPMSDRETLALIESYYAAFNRGDWENMLEHLTDDVVHDLNQGSRERGRAAFRAFLSRMNRCYSEQLHAIVVLASADGARAAAEYVVHGRYEASDEGLPEANGQTYELPGGAFFDVHAGRIARVTNYYNLQDWIAQVSR